MNVVAINGSPKKNGNTWIALKTVGEMLQNEGIGFEILHVGNKNIRGCLACRKCIENKNEKCSVSTDDLNQYLPAIKKSDGLILGSPVYYSGIAGTMKCFLDRLFYVSSANGNWMRHKVGTAVVAVRRSGGSMTLDSLNHYLTISEMLVPSSNYWNIIHGLREGDAEQDEEGIRTLQILGKNMAWMLKTMHDRNDIQPPLPMGKVFTNFIR